MDTPTSPWWEREGQPFQQSKSAVECFQRCPREFYNRYALELEPKGSTVYLDRGTAYGAAVAAWWMTPVGPGRRQVALDTLAGCPEYARLPRYQRILTRALVVGYDDAYRMVDSPQATGAEVELLGPLGGSVSRGLADIVVDLPGKPRVIVEFKTTEADIGDDTWWWERLRYDAQVAGYWNADPEARIIYDVCRVPAVKPFKATPLDKQRFYRRKSKCGTRKPGDPMRGTRVHDETLEEFEARVLDILRTHRYSHYRRKELTRSVTEKEHLSLDLVAWSRQILGAAERSEWPRKVSSCKRGKTGMCGFYPSCFEGAPLTVGANYKPRERH